MATVRCNGLTLCDYGGKIQLGTTPGDGGAGCIPREELARYIRTEPPGGETPSAQLLTFDAVSARHIDTRVRFDDVRFADAGKTWCDTDPETAPCRHRINRHRWELYAVTDHLRCRLRKDSTSRQVIDCSPEIHLRVTNRG